MLRAVARRAAASVGIALSGRSVQLVGTDGAIRRTFASNAGSSTDSKVPLMSIALGAAATATAYEAARSLEKPNPAPAAPQQKESAPGNPTKASNKSPEAGKTSKVAAAVEKKDNTEKKDTTDKKDNTDNKKDTTEKKEEPKAPVAKSDADLFYAQLLTQRRIFLNGRVDDKSAHTLVGKMLFLDAADPTKPIIMYINSGGGVVTSGLAIYDVMQHVRWVTSGCIHRCIPY